MVEELLEFLVGVIDTELLKAVLLEDLEASNVEDADPVGWAPRNRTVNGLQDTIRNTLCGPLATWLMRSTRRVKRRS
jgi:hypothetical protein